MTTRRFKAPCVMAAAAIMALPVGGASATETKFIVAPGFFLDISFGEQWNVGLGVDLHATMLVKSTDDDAFRQWSSVGVYAQATWLTYGRTARLSAGVHAGVVPGGAGLEHDFELGWLWQGAVKDQPGGHGFQVGYSTWLLIPNVSLRFTAFKGGDRWIPEGHLALGIHVLSRLGRPIFMGSPGRPQRQGDGLCVGRVFTRGSSFKRRDGTGAAARAAVGVRWAEAARTEAASVPAFVALARDLTHGGAPQTLVSRALVAAQDEVRHAQACAKLAQRYLGRRVAVEIPQVAEFEHESPPAQLLTRLAVESWKDGCLGEGIEAARAAGRAARATDPRMRRSLQAIAREEATHAELAWDVLAWATKTGGSPVKEAVARAVAETNAAPKANLDMRPRAKGQLDAAAKTDIAEAVRVAAIDRWRSEVI